MYRLLVGEISSLKSEAPSSNAIGDAADTDRQKPVQVPPETPSTPTNNKMVDQTQLLAEEGEDREEQKFRLSLALKSEGTGTGAAIPSEKGKGAALVDEQKKDGEATGAASSSSGSNSNGPPQCLISLQRQETMKDMIATVNLSLAKNMVRTLTDLFEAILVCFVSLVVAV